MKELKSKECRGKIFIDKVKNLVSAVLRAPGKHDYLMDGSITKAKRLCPATLVRGSYFTFFSTHIRFIGTFGTESIE